MPSDWFSRDQLRREILEHVDRRASPGLPLMRIAPTNGDLLFSKGELREDRFEFIYQCVIDKLENKTADPIRLFIKQEPHKMAKIEEGRFRLISSVSLIDSLIDRMIFGPFFDKVLTNYQIGGSMIGWTPLYGGWRLLPYQCYGYDMTAWDYTVPLWLIEDFLEVIRINLVTDSESAFGTWADLARWRFSSLFVDPTFVCSNGFRFKQLVSGLMKSGSFLTILGNTMMQLLLDFTLSFEAGEPLSEVTAMGDDTMRQAPLSANKLALFEKFGFIIKGCERNEFCGFKWGNSMFEPVYGSKHLCKLLYLEDELAVDTLRSYQLLYCKSTWYPRLVQIIMNYDPSILLPKEVVLSIFDG